MLDDRMTEQRNPSSSEMDLLDPIELVELINAEDRKGQSALMWAAVEGHREAVDLLLAAGADREATLRSGFNAWFFELPSDPLAIIITGMSFVPSRLRIRPSNS